MAELADSWAGLSRDILIEISPSLIAFLRIIKETISNPEFRTKFVSTVVSLFETVGSAFLTFTVGFIGFTEKVAKLIDSIKNFGKTFFANEKTGESDLKAAFDMKTLERVKAIKESFGLKLNSNEQKRYNMSVAQLAGEMDQEDSPRQKKVSSAFAYLLAKVEQLTKEIAVRAEIIRKQSLEGAVTYKPTEDAVDKFIEKISFKAVSNAASGAAPGKLSGADINTAAGLEMFLKSFEPGYGEDKQVTLLKEIKKEIQKGNNADNAPPVNLAGAT